jgi:uncharacterized membrane protein
VAQMTITDQSSARTYAPPLEPRRPKAPSRSGPRGWWPMLVLSFMIALYALSFYVRRSHAFPPQLVASFTARPWGIYTHVLFGALALLLGPFQFRRGILLRHRALHRNLGRVYVISALMTGIVGFYMSWYSYAGAVTHFGFGILGILTASTTTVAYVRIRAMDVTAHREWMIRSFALIFAAVTLRIELPLLIAFYHGAFTPAYQIVAWLCWVPNLLWAEWYVRRSRRTPAAQVPVHSRLQQGEQPTDSRATVR